MRLWSALIASACLARLAPAYGAEQPLLFATKDAQIRYRVTTGEQTAPALVTVQLSAEAHLARVLSPELDGYVLVSPLLDRVTLILPHHQAFSELALGANTERFMLLNSSMGFIAGESASVAGYSCREWTVRSSLGVGEACVTNDGLLLRASGNLGGDVSNKIEAISVDYAPQPAALFIVPTGLHRVVVPSPGQK